MNSGTMQQADINQAYHKNQKNSRKIGPSNFEKKSYEISGNESKPTSRLLKKKLGFGLKSQLQRRGMDRNIQIPVIGYNDSPKNRSKRVSGRGSLATSSKRTLQKKVTHLKSLNAKGGERQGKAKVKFTIQPEDHMPRIVAIGKNKNNHGRSKKYPGVSFLKSKVECEESDKGGLLSLSQFQRLQRRANESKEAYRKRKRKLKRQTKRDKEKLFRYNLQRAFDTEKVEITSKDELQVEIKDNLFDERGALSTFPIKFHNWVTKGNFYWRTTLDFDVTEMSNDTNEEWLMSTQKPVSEEISQVLSRSRVVNQAGAQRVSSLIDSLKELAFLQN